MYMCTLGMLSRKEFITNNPNSATPSPRKQVLSSKLSCIPMCITIPFTRMLVVTTFVGGKRSWHTDDVKWGWRMTTVGG